MHRFAALLFCVVLCAPAQATVRVVATIYPLADIARQIGGDAVEVVTLLPPGANPHTFEPTPQQIRAAAGARVFVQVGAGLDTWAAKVMSASAQMRTVTLADALPQLHAADLSNDPHLWLDPIAVRDYSVPAVLAALSAAVPADAAAALAPNAVRFQDTLTSLDREIRARLDSATNRGFISFHAGWRYFARRYGLHEVAVVEPSPGKEPSARDIAELVRRARAERITALLVEPQFPMRMADQIAREFGGRTVLVDPLGGPDVADRNGYVALLRYNAKMFADALR